MKKLRFTLMVLTTVSLTLLITSAVQAQATRTWVSGVGDDVNPCSRTAPCKTFAGAISKTAANGEIDALDPGGFGTITITKSITIDGTQGSGFGGILASLTSGSTINDSASGAPNTIVVTLRNLSIDGAGNGTNGIRFISGKSLSVENCQIFGFRAAPGHGIDMAITSGNAQLTVRDTIIHDNLGSAINMNISNVANTSGTLSLNNSRLSRCGNGITMSTGVSRATVRNSEIELMSGPGNGINLASGTPIIHLHHTSLSHNTIGIAAAAGSARLSDVYITNCATSMSFAGAGQVRSWGDNMIFENGTNTLPNGPTLTPKN